MGLAGCAGAEPPVVSGSASGLSPDALAGSQQTALVLPEGIKQSGIVKKTSSVLSAVARQALVDAHDAMEKKQWDRLTVLVPVASQDPVLGPYAEYWLLHQQLNDSNQPVPVVAIQRFLSTNPDAYLTDRLKGDWIIAAARTADYASVNRIGPTEINNASVDCSRLLAQHMTGKRVSAEQAMAVFEPVRACWALFDQLVPNKVIGWKQLDPLLRATLETSKTGNAQRIADYMFLSPDMQSYRELMKNPKKWLSKQGRPASQEQIELVTLALSRLARDDREDNAAYVKSQWANAIPKSQLEWVWGQFGLISALNVETQAVQWYRLSGQVPMTDYNHAWQVRSELRQAPIDWSRVRQAIEKMTRLQQSEPVWVYWHGRASAALGQRESARKQFASLEHEYSFYGQLATEEMGRSLVIPPEPAAVTTAELRAAQANPGLQRATALFDLGWRHQAVPEWNFALRGMSDRQLLAAAELARREEIFDRVVNTSLRTKQQIDFKQRFIAPFEGRVSEKARLINLDVAWVYGLIRQESRFITNARSHVGASGLMQLMPATAKWVAKKIGMKDFTPSSVNDFDTNTVLGTNYLSMVLGDLDGSQVLATAGYNAGPRRPVQWRSKLAGPVEGAVFAETIPFTETRLYVKNVMSNATYYAMMFSGKSHSLKARLGTVSPEPSKRVNLP